MPYLAPYLLKGFLREHSTYTITADDLNIQYFNHLLTPQFAARAIDQLGTESKLEARLIAELLATEGLNSWNALRDLGTYQAPAEVGRHLSLLSLAPRIAATVDQVLGNKKLLPAETYGEWPALLQNWEPTVLGKYLESRIDHGLYSDCDVLGICMAYQNQIARGLLLARLLKRRRPDIKIVVGGPALTHFLTEIEQDLSFWSDVDFAIPYQGEYLFLELLQFLSGTGKQPRHNVAWREKDKIFYIKDLKKVPRTFPIPDFSDLQHLYPTPEPVYPLLTSKGCYWGKCAFCTHHEGYGEAYYLLPKERIAQALHMLRRVHDTHYVYFVDEALPPVKIVELAQILANEGGVKWTVEARSDKVLCKPAAVTDLARSGCVLLVSGIESGCQEVVDRMEKGTDLSIASELARTLDTAGIRVGWMFFVGFPGEQEEQIRETFQFIRSNLKHLQSVAIGLFALERGSPVFLNRSKYGVKAIEGALTPYKVDFDFYTVDRPELITSGVLEAQLSEALAQFPEVDQFTKIDLGREHSMFIPKNIRIALGAGDCAPASMWTWNSQLTLCPVSVNLNTMQFEYSGKNG
jgi:anaerobic magnesium-protoporphyrin IX monomethyl ester cyclase